jgi:hypothetical protein
MTLEYKRPGQRLDTEDWNELIAAINRMKITAGPGLEVHEDAGGITINLKVGRKKRLAIETD